MRRIPPAALLLWLEALALAIIAPVTGHGWLWPLAGLLALFAALLSRGLSLALPAAVLLPVASFLHGRGAPLPVEPLPVAFPVLALVLGTLCAFLSILTGLSTANERDALRERLVRLAVLLHFLVAGLFFAGRIAGLSSSLWIAWGSGILAWIVTGDTLAKLLSRLYTPRRHWASLPRPGALFFFRWLGREWRDCLPPRRESDETSLRLTEMWMWPSVRRSLPLLAVATALLVWLSTGLHEVATGGKGVRQRCGAWEARTLDAGLHLSLPWPFGDVRQVDTGKVREIVLGFRADPGQPILWERAHYEDEQKSLVGGGDDFLSISVPVFYRIEDPSAWLRASAEGEALFKTLADRVLLRLTLHQSAAELMTSAREPLRHAFHRELQQELDRRGCGLRIGEVYFRDIHPPVAVAPAFQEVVGALEEKEASLHEGEEYRRDVLTRAKGDVIQVVVNATSTAENRLTRVRGETSRFNRQLESWRRAPALFELREGFRAFDRTLGGAKKAIFDEKLRGSIPTHLDLRKVLNPDFVNGAEPAPQSLVPRPPKSRDAFDLDIEGFLRTDRGDVPAVNVAPGDQDNLLNAAPSTPSAR